MALGQYSLTATLTLALLFYIERLWQADFTAPLSYGNDGLMVQVWWKAVLDFGWYLDNPMLGAPHGQQMHDYPLVESLNFMIVKFFGLLSHNIVFVTNAFILSTYVLAALGAQAALRAMKISYVPALACSLVYAFLPYHFYRLTGHHFLACYYVVPLSCLLALRVYEGGYAWPFGKQAPRRGIASDDAGARTGSWDRANDSAIADEPLSWLFAVAICVMQASAGVYYAFFAEYFLLVAGLAAGLRQRAWRPLAGAGLMVSLTGIAVLANLAPTLIFQARHGANPDIATRLPRESEWFGYKIAASVLPIPDHKIKPLSDLRWRYEGETVRSNEGAWAAQGLVANLGFFVLFGVLLSRRKAWPWLEGLSVLNIFGVLLGTMGGFGMIFSMLVSAQIRSYNRISIFLSFLSLACVAVLVDRLWRRVQDRPRSRRLVVTGIAAMVAFALWDQYPRTMRPDYGHLHRQWHKDHRFTQKIEAAAPAGAMVYQLPFTRYPESPAVLNHHAYFAIRYYLHSDTLRWSCGALRGREGEQWQMRTAELPLDEQLEAIAAAGFGGIQIFRPGYEDYGKQIESELEERLGVKPIVNEHGRETFFPMTTFLAARAAKSAAAGKFARGE